ncbi:MAG: hypothetical protein GY820_08375 [Gammaproteobacteria bacterium]|nr:hypothetical protein [Gammaproteobacteria bacterium]
MQQMVQGRCAFTVVLKRKPGVTYASATSYLAIASATTAIANSSFVQTLTRCTKLYQYDESAMTVGAENGIANLFNHRSTTTRTCTCCPKIRTASKSIAYVM